MGDQLLELDSVHDKDLTKVLDKVEPTEGSRLICANKSLLAFAKEANCGYRIHGKTLRLYVEEDGDVFVEHKSRPRTTINNMEPPVSFHFEEIVISLELFATIDLRKAMLELTWLSCSRLVYHGYSIINFPDYGDLSVVCSQLKARDVRFNSISSLGTWSTPGRLAVFSYADIFGVQSFKFLNSFTSFSYILLDLATSISMANDLLLPTLVQDGLGQKLKWIRCYFHRNDEGDLDEPRLREVLETFLASISTEDIKEKLPFEQEGRCLLRQRISNGSGQHALMLFSKIDRPTKLFHLNRLQLDFVLTFDPEDSPDLSVFSAFNDEE